MGLFCQSQLLGPQHWFVPPLEFLVVVVVVVVVLSLFEKTGIPGNNIQRDECRMDLEKRLYILLEKSELVAK